jgi:hypothetical protein
MARLTIIARLGIVLEAARAEAASAFVDHTDDDAFVAHRSANRRAQRCRRALRTLGAVA